MKETKVYVDELPENCKKCVYSQINLALGVETRICGLQYGFISIDIDKFPNCPLQSLQAHDRELVKEVCEKIRSELEKELKYDFTSYVPIMNVCNKINRVLDQIQKEYEK